MNRVRWHNVVFRNLTTDAEHALLDSRAVISGFSMLVERPTAGHRDATPQPPALALLFVVTTRDTNRNGVLDAGDLQSLILTGPTGENPRVITPDGTVMTNVQFYAPARKLLIELRRDTDDDGVVNYDDEPAQYICDVPGGTARPLISSDTASRVRALLK
ncbi:MAG: EF-hand domain-containing protein [Planctomycetota bacterium]|nr:EF-hand domain-containing protein [Planctomycetota bacterium]